MRFITGDDFCSYSYLAQLTLCLLLPTKTHHAQAVLVRIRYQTLYAVLFHKCRPLRLQSVNPNPNHVESTTKVHNKITSSCIFDPHLDAWSRAII